MPAKPLPTLNGRLLLQSAAGFPGPLPVISTPGPGYYAALPVAPALGPALNPSAAIYPASDATVLAIQPNNGYPHISIPLHMIDLPSMAHACGSECLLSI